MSSSQTSGGDEGMNINDLIADDEFVLRVAYAAQIRTWADDADLWNIDRHEDLEVSARLINEGVRQETIDDLRARLERAFSDWAPPGDGP